MIPAPLLAFVRYLVVWECARLTAKGWTVFDLDADTMSVMVNFIALAVTGLGMYAATLARRLAHLVDRHPAALLDAAAAVPGVTRIEATPDLAAETKSTSVVPDASWRGCNDSNSPAVVPAAGATP